MVIPREEVLGWLSSIPDPEIPVINIVELGIVRDILIDGGSVTVSITPTYTGCPAMRQIEEDILGTLNKNGVQHASVKLVYDPAWTTDWISEDTRLKLKRYGIAPPLAASSLSVTGELVQIGAKEVPVPCPFCESHDTKCKSQFGSTACKSLWYCNSCCQPFEHFKSF